MSNFPHNHSHASVGSVFLWPRGDHIPSCEAQTIFHQILNKSNGILLDSNILLYNHCMLYKNKDGLIVGKDAEDASTYQKIVEHLKTSKAIKTDLFIHSAVISEFASIYLRLAFLDDRWKDRKNPAPPFRAKERKDYIKAEDGKKAVRTIAKICQEILRDYKALECEDGSSKDGLNKKEMGEITAKYAQGGMEFTDCIIASICSNHNLALLTNDGDFASTQGFPIVTANRRLMKKRER